jgi:hypothetical protein
MGHWDVLNLDLCHYLRNEFGFAQPILQHFLKYADREAAFRLFREFEIQLGLQHSTILPLLGFALPNGTVRPELESDFLSLTGDGAHGAMVVGRRNP